MSNKPRGVGFWISAWWPVAVGIAVIAMESTMYFGADHTSGPLRWLFQALFGPVSDARWDIIHHYARKSGHFVGYGALGVLWLRAWRMSLPSTSFLVDSLLGVAGTALVATFDEWHQTFLPNRTGTAWDVLLDSIGASVMIGCVYLYLRRFHSGRLRPDFAHHRNKAEVRNHV